MPSTTNQSANAHNPLDDRYRLTSGDLFLSGSQALVRLLLEQRRRDRLAGVNTAGFVSGYRGSPLAGLDLALWRAGSFLERESIKFEPGLNEDLAMTAVGGSQQTDIFGPARVDGVFGMWYGKNPGLDRSGDALKHGNAVGTSRHGGVLVVSGDDPGASSSTIANQSEQAFMSAMVPVIYPADIGDILELGLMGYGFSRYSGLWAGLKLVSDVVETTRSVAINGDVGKFILPDVDGFSADQVIQRWPDDRWSQDQRTQNIKIPAALEFARANSFNRIVMDAPGRSLGIVSAGKAYQDVRQALDMLGITNELATQIGLTVYKLGLIWPIEPEGARAFAGGLKEIMVVEERRAFIEIQLKEMAFNWPASIRPRIIGKTDQNGAPLIPSTGESSPSQLALIIGRRLLQTADHPLIRENFARVERDVEQSQARDRIPLRIPHYCPGCPHNGGTKVPDGGVAMAGIGCHSLAMWMPGNDTVTITHMGGEGANWIGAAAFVARDHMFQNMGDGTYAHSGALAIRAALAAKSRITFKILYNNAVAMTGGQPVEGGPTVSDIARQMVAEGVTKLAVVSDAPKQYSGGVLPAGTQVHDRQELEPVMADFARFPGTSVLIYDQMCATEKRRQRKRGRRAPAEARVVINERVCEACGDCSVQSRCIAVRAVSTPLGLKRQVDQSSCNSDLSCLQGFCPAMVTVTGAKLRAPEIVQDGGWLINEPTPAELAAPYNILIAGVGGTGLITIGAILGMAAHLDGIECSVLDNTGLARMGGAVTTHLRLAPAGTALDAPRIGVAGADLLLGCDALVTAGPEVFKYIHKGRTSGVVNSHMAPTAAEALDPEAPIDRDAVFAALNEQITDDVDNFADAGGLALALLGDRIYANMLLTGFAYQKGHIPLSGASVEQAIVLNGTETENNLRAFAWGRRLAVDRQRVLELAGMAAGAAENTLGDRITFRMQELTRYRNRAYAVRYGELVDKFRAKETEITGATGALTGAVADNYYKVLAIKDEFEVARLFTDGAFDAELSALFEDGYRVQYHVGRLSGGGRKKQRFGPWFGTALGLAAKFKALRFIFLNPFFFTRDRKRDRNLIAEYETAAAELLEHLDARNLKLATEIAAIPDAIRGFGPIRDRSLIGALKRHDHLLAEFRNTGGQG